MLRIFIITCISLLFFINPISAYADDAYQKERMNLIREIEFDVKQTASYTGIDKLDPKVIESMKKTLRHLFVPIYRRLSAYKNHPLPIGYGQTISQPYIVALMTDIVEPKSNHIVLEIGTGSAYQAAVIAPLVKKVFSIEIIPPLAKSAQERLKDLGYKNVSVITGDGYYGLPKSAPFDIIIVTAAADHIPPPLITQLKPGGKMIIPVGRPFQTQHLILVEKLPNGKTKNLNILPVAFVPLTGKR